MYLSANQFFPKMINFLFSTDFDVASHGDTAYRMDGALAEAQSELEKEEEDVERALCEIAVQVMFVGHYYYYLRSWKFLSS